ncbi:hypothetical protein K438DRAFT_1838146 [Mycena galopus ATCC 62051]|nr:hypothetical protein K438DRAFT_1838146 [Mycena galopus ATCC 62051]
MSALETNDLPSEEAPAAGDTDDPNGARRSISDGPRRPRLRPLISGVADMTMSALNMSMSALETDDESEDSAAPPAAVDPMQHQERANARPKKKKTLTHAFEAATRLGRCLSDAALASPSDTSPLAPDANGANGAMMHFSSPGGGDIAAQLFNNPKLAAFRAPLEMARSPLTMTMTSLPSLVSVSQPILVNPKCSGYLVEPMKWMELFLESGQINRKIVCANKKCSAKLGNYDWAGM